MQTLMEPTNPLHTALQALGDIPIPMADTQQIITDIHLRLTRWDHTYIYQTTTITCSYTNTHTPALIHTYTQNSHNRHV